MQIPTFHELLSDLAAGFALCLALAIAIRVFVAFWNGRAR